MLGHKLTAGVEPGCIGAVRPPDLDGASDETGRNRVVVAPQRQRRLRCDRAKDGDLGRIRDLRQPEQRLSVTGRTDGRIAPTTLVGQLYTNLSSKACPAAIVATPATHGCAAVHTDLEVRAPEQIEPLEVLRSTRWSIVGRHVG